MKTNTAIHRCCEATCVTIGRHMTEPETTRDGVIVGPAQYLCCKHWDDLMGGFLEDAQIALVALKQRLLAKNCCD